MDLISWLKINVVKNLDISGWFKNWFNKTEITITTVNVNLNIPLASSPSVGVSDDLTPPNLSETTAKISFSTDQLNLISKINEVHRIHKLINYDFKEDYKWALYYITHKPAVDWPYNAAIRIAQALQDVDLFSSFEDEKDPEKKDEFNNLKHKINYLYNRIIQELRHTNKRGQIEKQFKAPYHNELGKEPRVENADYEQVFDDFQDLLMQLFGTFKLK